jgi:hypothetical protein
VQRGVTGIMGRLGWISLPQNRSVILCVPDADACPYVSQLVALWRKEQPRTSFFLIPGDEAARSWLLAHCQEPVIGFPINSSFTSFVFLLLTRVRIIIILGHPFWLPSKLLNKAYDLGVPLIVARCRLPHVQDFQQMHSRRSQWIDWWEPLDLATGRQLNNIGVSGDRIAPPSALDEPSSDSWAKLQQLAARRPPVRRPLQRFIQQALESPFWQKLVQWRARRLDSMEEFREALGRPTTIMCLGNGPSCEDPALDQHDYDALFRVNYRWRLRRKFTDADVVFTGQKRTLFSVHPRIFAFQTRRAETQLVTHQIFNPLCHRMIYVTLERIGIIEGKIWDQVRPTNGATMIAAAVALNPRKLIIGGIDLFEDPVGAYPGDTATPNAYVAVHNSETELKFILNTVARYTGELIIIGKVLGAKWREYDSSLARGAPPRQDVCERSVWQLDTKT